MTIVTNKNMMILAHLAIYVCLFLYGDMFFDDGDTVMISVDNDFY